MPIHEDNNSLRLLSVEMLGSLIMKYFSHRQRLHLFEALLYDLARLSTFHLMSNPAFLLFKSQMCLLSSVAFRLVGLVKEAL